jgi:steroid 5-alpha reductase family enzyme
MLHWLAQISENYYEGLWLFVPLAFIIALYLLIMLIIVQVKKDSSIANFVWGGGCLIIVWYLYFIAPLIEKKIIGTSERGIFLDPWFNRSLIIMVLISLWALRLALYVYLRYRGDDPRYQSWKKGGFTQLLFNLVWIFGLNTLMMLVMSVPSFFVMIPAGTSRLGYLDWLGLLVWIFGYYWESVSDYQMFTFTRNPSNKGKVMKYGLWKYSRHPNYFGEILMWWGIFLIALNVSVVTIIAPLTITFLLLFVTGIPWAEKSMANNLEYQEYKKHTRVLIPWFPK